MEPRSHETAQILRRAQNEPVAEMRPATARGGRQSSDLAGRDVTGDERIAKVSLVGVGMRSHMGIAFWVVIDEKYLELAVRVPHDAFELARE